MSAAYPLPDPPPPRLAAPREDLSRGVLLTTISPKVAWAMTALFCAALVVVPVVQIVVELTHGQDVQALTLFRRTPTKDHLREFEDDLDRQAIFKEAIQPNVQWALTGALGVGNTNAVVGRAGWLFYRPGVDFVAGPGLLDEDRLRLRLHEMADAGDKNPSPDPRPAIRAFDAACRKAGAHLVVVPIPDKATLQPGELTSRLAVRAPGPAPTNRDYPRLLDELRAAGIDVFDPTPSQLVPGEAPRFLRHDTHWNPDWMETVARDLAAHLAKTVPSQKAQRFDVAEVEVHGTGDLVDLLHLPTGQRLYAPQTVTVRRVRDADSGAAWQPHEDADVLLLGDSFSNIYGTPDLGWGEGAGFPAQLARFLGRDVDTIACNGGGGGRARRELLRRPDPLSGKRLVVWEFAARDLAQANWEVLEVPAPATRPITAPTAAPAVVDATVLATSRVPQPFAVPYKDCLTYVKVRIDRVAEGHYDGGEMLVVLWGMKDNVLQPAARYEAGKRLRLQVIPLRDAPQSLRSARSVDDLDDYDHLPYFASEEQER